MEKVLSKNIFLLLFLCFSKVNINPAYRTHELEYSLNKVGCKAIVMSSKFKTQDYVQMLSEICPEIDSSPPGQLKAKRVPQLKNVVLIGDEKHK